MSGLKAALFMGLVLALPAVSADSPTEIDTAFSRLYNFDFPGTHAALDKRIAAHPEEPMAYSVRASAYLFYELDRLSILESEFFADDKRIADRRRVKPDPVVRGRLFQALDDAQSRAQGRLDRNPNDQDSLFAFCITTGVLTDYTALVEKRQIGSLSLVKRGAAYAQRLLKLNPKYYDAYLTTGVADYLIGSLPFFVRWFIKVDSVEGNKEHGIQTVELVANHGRYLKPFAKILLAVAQLRDKKPAAARAILAELVHDYPENPLFQREYARLAPKLQRAP